MGRRGPPPKPQAIRDLEGDLSKGKVKRRAAVHRGPQKWLRAPSWLGRDGKAAWKRLLQGLRRLRLLDGDLDYDALERYCRAYEQWRRAERKVALEGETYSYVNTAGSTIRGLSPWVAYASDREQMCHKILGEFGLSPAARTRLQANLVEEKKSPWQGVLAQG